jgi:3-dehydroquinate synthase
MKNQEIKFNNLKHKYSILIGKNVLGLLPKKIKLICPETKKIAIIIDKNVPNKFIKTLKNKLKGYKLIIVSFSANEKFKCLKTVNLLLDKLLSNNFNRSDLVISVGGGITGDVTGFVASIFKRGINFINIPTTLLAQVDSSIGGKTGVNSNYGKNLIGSFYQPKLVISDTSFLDSLTRKEMICGYAEVLKHSIIKDQKFFQWLKNNTKYIFLKKPEALIYAIKKSCEIKMYFVNKDVNEKNIRMILNFGHTFAHAIEVKHNYSKKITHGEAVLSGMILALRVSILKKICNKKTVDKIVKIYDDNNLSYTYKKYSNSNSINDIIPFLKNDKKNNDEKINFILLKKIGKTSAPNKNKISINNLKKLSKFIAQY